MKRRYLVVGLALCCPAAIPAQETLPGVEAKPPPAPAGPAATAGIRVASVALGSALDPGKRIAAPKSLFAPTDTIYASVDTAGSGAPVTLTARWTYEDGQIVNETSETISPSGPAATEFHIAKPDGWPAGRYKVEITSNGMSAGAREFEVR